MNNNQFKKVIRKHIEDKANEKLFQVLYVDKTNNTRLYYLYGLSWNYITTIETYISDKEIIISVPIKVNAPLSICNKRDLIHTDYLHLQDIFQVIKNYLEEDIL